MTRFLFLPLLLLLLASCRHDDIIYIPEDVPTGEPVLTSVRGFYMLNEGNMGTNKCTLDYYDFQTANYTRNIYAAANPNVPKELGDVGNDLKIYGSKLYAVINCSNKIEVMDARDARRVGQVDIPNCRSIVFHGGYAYVTSYAGPVEIRPDYSQLGYVAKIDTATLQIVDRCIVGYQPDGIALSGEDLYVANSGGYRVPNYENTLSRIPLSTFREAEKIPLTINLDNVVADSHGQVWVSARGDYYGVTPSLVCYDSRKRRVTATFSLPVSAMWLHEGTLFTIGKGEGANSFIAIDTATRTILNDNFIADGTGDEIKVPYALAVHPITGDIYVSDARTYLNPGYLHCYTSGGSRMWSVRTGDIPAHIAFRE